MEMESDNTNQLQIKKINDETNFNTLRPLDDIINNNLSNFELADVINIFFEINKNKTEYKEFQELDYPGSLSSIKQNIYVQLKIFFNVLMKKYDEQDIINVLYEYFLKKSKEAENASIKDKNKEITPKENCKKIKKSVNKKKCVKTSYLQINTKKTRRKRQKIMEYKTKIKNNLIIPIKSEFPLTSLNEEDKAQNIIGYLYKNNYNHIFIYYPIFEEKNFINDNMNKILKDKNKILFVCELFNTEEEDNKCNSYGIYDLDKRDFSLGAIHTKSFKEHPHSIKKKIKNTPVNQNQEIMEIINNFSKMKTKGALIVKEE